MIDNCVYSTPEIERILKLAFSYAEKRDKRLTVVDKANVLATSRLWREVAQKMEPEHKDIAVDYMFVDNAAMQLIQWPKKFDVLVTENMFGDIISDEASVSLFLSACLFVCLSICLFVCLSICLSIYLFSHIQNVLFLLFFP